MMDSRPLIEGQPAVEERIEHRHGRRHRHRHGPGQRAVRKIRQYRTHILMVVGLIVLLVVWYMVASYEPKSPLM